MQVSFVDLGAQYREIKDEIHAELQKVLDTTSFVLGPAVTDFEHAFAQYCGVEHCVGVASGADALQLAFLALGIGPGDEVITAANTFIATVNAITLTGATPVLVDCDPKTYNIDPDLIETAITERTKAVVPVHLYGQPAEMDKIMAIAGKHGLLVVEDAAQAHGARYKGRRVGTFGDIGCFSFYPGKNLGAYGEGGAVVTADAKLADTVRILRNVGQSEKYIHPMVGFNSRLQSVQAAILNVKLQYLDRWNSLRQGFAALYTELLTDSSLMLPSVIQHAEPVWHLYVVQHERRDGLMKHLSGRQILCGIHYPVPIHHQKAYPNIRTVPEGAPVTSAAAKRLLSLPMHPHLTAEQVHMVVNAIKDFARA